MKVKGFDQDYVIVSKNITEILSTYLRYLQKQEKELYSIFQYHLLDSTVPSISREYDNRTYSGFQCSVKVGETFDVQHVDFINEQDSWN